MPTVGQTPNAGPSGEIGRHIGLKIRRFVNNGRTGSIPVSGTTSLITQVSRTPLTRSSSSYNEFFVASHGLTE